MRIHFELEIESANLNDCRAVILDKVANFLGIDITEVTEKIDIELQIKGSESSEKMLVSAFVKLKYIEK